MQIDNDMQTHSMFSKLFVHSKSYILSCSNILNGSIEKLFMTPAWITFIVPNHLCKIQKCVLTQFTRGCWISNITVRTSTNWLVSNNFAISISCTWIFFSARIDTFSIFTCGVIRTITIWCTANCKRWRLYFFYQIEKSKEVEILGSLKG